MQFSDQAKKIIISQLINSISMVLKYCNGTIIWTSFVPSFLVWPVIFYLYLDQPLSGKLGTSTI